MTDYSKKTDVELKQVLNEKRSALRKFRFSQSHAKTRNVKEGRDTRKEIAQILTQINARSKSDKK